MSAEPHNFMLNPFPAQSNYDYSAGHVPLYYQNSDGSDQNYMGYSNFQGMDNFEEFNQN